MSRQALIHCKGCLRRGLPVLGFEVEDVGAAREELARRGVEFVTEALEFEGDASSAKFLGPGGLVYEVWRPEERFRMGREDT